MLDGRVHCVIKTGGVVIKRIYEVKTDVHNCRPCGSLRVVISNRPIHTVESCKGAAVRGAIQNPDGVKAHVLGSAVCPATNYSCHMRAVAVAVHAEVRI